MNNKFWQHIQFLPLALVAIMALTRFDHFGSAFSLPDASLAVFFLAGMGFSSLWFFALLLLEAGMIDYLAITQFSVSDFCISPAYVCLIPTYAAMWFAGRYCTTFKALGFSDSFKTFGLATIATTVAFVVSNGSFYVLSDRFGQLSWTQYLTQSAQYYPLYISAALIYIVIGLAIVKLWKATHQMATVES
ncbi:MAG: hypothetical protein ABL884_04580 [Methyloglobulus sp.]